MGKDIIKKQDQAVAVVPEARLGFEADFSPEDLIMPRVKLFQGNATEAEQYPNAKGGQLLNSLTADILPETFIPVFMSIEWLKFNGRPKDVEGYDPNYEPGALIWKTSDKNDPKVAEDENSWRNKTLKFLCYFPGVDMPLVVTFAKTSFNAGKRLLSLAQFSGGNMFSKKYRLTTKKEQKDGSTYYVMVVDPVGVATAEEQAVCAQWYTDFRGKQLNVHEENTATTEKPVNWQE